jgi:hypothetical protein
VDGANLGISFDSDGNPLAQNRGAYLQPPYSGQWKKLGEWLAPTTDILFEKLLTAISFLEMVLRPTHNLLRPSLPDWFFALMSMTSTLINSGHISEEMNFFQKNRNSSSSRNSHAYSPLQNLKTS